MPPCVGGFSKARPEQGLIILALFLTAMLLPMSHFEKEQRFLASFFSFSFLFSASSQSRGGWGAEVHAEMDAEDAVMHEWRS